MKHLLGAASAALLLVCAPSAMAAQASASVTATAVVITPLTESVTTNLNFGKLVMDASNSLGTLVVAPATGTRSVTGGVDLVGGTSGTAAVVHVVGDTVNGAPNPYDVTIDSSTTLTDGGSDTMSVTGIGSSDTLTGITGTNDIHIGATLHAAASQAPSTYTGSFNVTAAYE